MQLGARVAQQIQSGVVFELVGDVGAGKTSFTKGLAAGLGVTEPVQSPTFTISREYTLPDSRRLVHYDFYRLGEAGIMAEELDEVVQDERAIVVVEWAHTVADVLPRDRVTLHIALVADDETAREVTWQTDGAHSDAAMKGVMG